MKDYKLIILLIICFVIGSIFGKLLIFRLTHNEPQPKIIEKVINHEWKVKDTVLINMRHADSIKIIQLSNAIKERESRLERLKMILLKDTTKTSLEADSIIRSQDSTINDLGDEAELYSSQLHKANRQISIRDSVILDREKTIKDYSDLVGVKQSEIDKLNKKNGFQRFLTNTFATATGILTIITIVKK